MFSSAAKDAIRACAYLAVNANTVIGAANIASSLSLPAPFMAKTAQKLVKANILNSQRGSKGGVWLSRSPADINILSIIHAIDTDKIFDQCILGMGACESETPCCVHHIWDKQKQELIALLEATTLQDVLSDIERQKILRL